MFNLWTGESETCRNRIILRNFSIVRLVSKISHPRLAARLIENENNSK